MKVYNTFTKKKEIVESLKNNEIDLFVCGPTVYDYSHLGHAKIYTQFDFIVKYLRNRGFKVFYLQNITDIDDKILKRARELNVQWNELTKKYEQFYLEDMQQLHNNSVSEYARATDHIGQIVRQVKTLVEKGYAYTTSDGIYFEISKFPEYGNLSGRTNLKKDDAVSRIDENTEKRGWNDFCLWKFSKSDEPSWNTEIGSGRPGWHIEDTAITEKYFGPQYDIHGGAIDLIIPHHEAEIAQMEAASGKKPLVRYWMHVGFLNIDNEKMSKSKGNFTTIRDALEIYDYRVLRYLFISNHYRSSLNFNEKSLAQASDSLKRIDEFVFGLTNKNSDADDDTRAVDKLRRDVFEKIDDDFNTPSALAKIFDFIREQNVMHKGGPKTLLLLKDFNQFFDFIDFHSHTSNEIDQLIKERDVLRALGDFKKADQLRRRIEEMGVKIYDSKTGTTWRKI